MKGTWGFAAAALLPVFAVLLSPAAQPSTPNTPTKPTMPSIPGLPFPGGPSHTFTVPPPTGGPAPSVPTLPLIPRSDTVTMTLAADGSLSVRERVAVPANGPMTRTVPLSAGTRVRDATVEGHGIVRVTADTMVIRLDGGAATVRYTVDGAVAGTEGGPELRWQPVSGWDHDLLLARVTLTAPQPPTSVTCLAGPAGSTTPCRTVRTDAKMVTRIAQLRLPEGDRLALTARFPPGSVRPNAVVADQEQDAGPFALTWFSGIGVLVLLGGFALLWLLRGRNAKPAARQPVPLLHQDGEHVVFTPPGGILPGQLGMDVSATVVDLAVRGYLLVVHGVAADGSPDWQLIRNRPADEALTGYERALLDTLLPPGVESVSLADLRTNPVDLAPVRHALHADVAARGFLGTRPDDERGRFALGGAVLTVLGVLVTLVLAFTVGQALIGLAVVVAGLVVLVGAGWMPSRGAQGGVLLDAAGDLRNHLATTTPARLPAADRDTVFARSLPYAMVLGHAPHWLHTFAELDDGEGRYWYVAGEQPRSFAEDFLAFQAALAAAVAGRATLPRS